MKAADLYRLMESPALLTEDTLQQLKQIVDEFPYFQIARMLYLKNLAVLNDIRFGAELKKMAIYVPDRRKLFTLIEGERFGLQLQSAKEENPTREDAFSLIDAFLSNREEEEPKTDASLLFQPSVSSDYIYWSLTKENGQVEEKEEEEEVRLQHHDLIDSFIKNEEQRTPGSGLNLDMETTGAPVPGNLAELEENQHKPLDDSYFTETLAHIYVKQKRYEKALQIIKNLNLKYPEKNVYFADQIRFLESYRPPLDGERYLTDGEVAELLRVSRRTLQEYRNNRVLSFILLGGKVLYPETGLREVLEANYRKPLE